MAQLSWCLYSVLVSTWQCSEKNYQPPTMHWAIKIWIDALLPSIATEAQIADNFNQDDGRNIVHWSLFHKQLQCHRTGRITTAESVSMNSWTLKLNLVSMEEDCLVTFTWIRWLALFPRGNYVTWINSKNKWLKAKS